MITQINKIKEYLSDFNVKIIENDYIINDNVELEIQFKNSFLILNITTIEADKFLYRYYAYSRFTRQYELDNYENGFILNENTSIPFPNDIMFFLHQVNEDLI